MKNICRPVFAWLAAIAGAVLVAGLCWPSQVFPPWRTQREAQRRTVRERVEALGGWNVLEAACRSLSNDNHDGFLWPQMEAGSASNLPPAIAQLHPSEVRATPGEPAIVRIKLFGMHSTGNLGVPYDGLWVVCGPSAPGYTPKFDFGGSIVTGEIHNITNSIYEAY